MLLNCPQQWRHRGALHVFKTTECCLHTVFLKVQMRTTWKKETGPFYGINPVDARIDLQKENVVSVALVFWCQSDHPYNVCLLMSYVAVAL